MRQSILFTILLFFTLCANAQSIEQNYLGQTSQFAAPKQMQMLNIDTNTSYRKGHIYIDGIKITRNNMSLYLDAEMQKLYKRGRRCMVAGNTLSYIGGGFIALGAGVAIHGLTVDVDPNSPTSGAGYIVIAGGLCAAFGAILGGTGLIVRSAGKNKVISVGTNQNGVGLTVKF